ncbi:MAG: bifunctional DNA primase/polymerase [Candidatus Parvarchaeota archaeon]
MRPRSKIPFEKAWNRIANYSLDSDEIKEWTSKGANWGITCPRGDCAFIDADTKEIQDILDSRLTSFWYTTGRKGHRQYVYGILDPPIKNIPLKDGAYIKGQNGYALGPGSIHPNGRIYGQEKSNLPIREVSKQELLGVLEPFLIRKNEPQRNRPVINKSTISWISLSDIIDLSKFKRFGSQYQGAHPIHGSTTGTNLCVDVERNLWHCFRCDSGGSTLEWIAVAEGIIDCKDAVPGALRGNRFWQVLEVAHVKYGLTTEVAVKMLKGGVKK